MGTGRRLTIQTPWANRTKREILFACQPNDKAFDLVCRSWSCYRSTGPCGECGACVKRADAFTSMGVEDLSGVFRMFGGDPQRVVG